MVAEAFHIGHSQGKRAMMKDVSFRIGILVIGMAVQATAGDWPNWRGSNFDGISGEALPESFPDEAPVIWRTKVGTGFSTVSVSGGSVFTMGNAENRDTVWCLDAETGEVKWKHSYDCELDPLYYEGGPSATPTVHGDSIFTFGKKGQVFRFDLETGRVIWKRNIAKDLDLELPEWSFASSPYIHGELVILNAGGSGVALQRKSGEIAWASDTKTAGYATPVPRKTAGGVELLLFGGRELMGIVPESGKVRWRLPWETGREVNAADPIISTNRALVTSAIGAALIEFDETGESPREVWREKSALRCYFNPPVLVKGHLYAIHGTTHRPTELVCLDWETGETRWSEPGFGSGALMAAGDKGILFDKGQLTIFRLNPEKYEPLFQQQVLAGKCWTVPVLANGVIFCRNAKGDLAAVDLSP